MSSKPEPPDAQVTDTPRRVLLADDSYRILREALITNRLVPGQRLNIEQLAEDMNVSITPIRHALVRLEADRLVTREQYKGYVVSRLLDPSTVSEIFDARTVIEMQTVARAAERASKADVGSLVELAEQDPVGEVPEDLPGFEDNAPQSYDVAFHLRIAQVAGNSVLVDLLRSLDDRMSAYRSFRTQLLHTKWSPSGEFLIATKREHAAIVRAIRRGDAEAAQAAMLKHVGSARHRDVDALPDDLDPALGRGPATS